MAALGNEVRDCPLATLLAAATRAPSGDNRQPWRFAVDRARRQIAMHVDPARDSSPMNGGQRMSRVAVGAALENMLRTAQRNGWDVKLETPSPPGLALVRVKSAGDEGGAVEPVILARVSNRRRYDGRAVVPQILTQLTHLTPEVDGVRTHWLTDRQHLPAWGSLIGRTDCLMFGERSMRQAFLANVRFDAPAAAEVSEGLSLASLELKAADRLALRWLRRLPHWVVRTNGVLRGFAAHTRKLVESASGLCLVVAPDHCEATDLLVGSAVQRAWLALTAQGLAVQPMMSLLVLENVLDHGSPTLLAALGREPVEAMRHELRALAPEIGPGRPAFLLRFGYAPSPSGRTGRLPWQALASPADSHAMAIRGGPNGRGGRQETVREVVYPPPARRET